MEQNVFDGIIFTDSQVDAFYAGRGGRVAHILCYSGSIQFTFHNTRYTVRGGDYAVLPNFSIYSDIEVSDDFSGISMTLSETFIASIAIKSNYGTVGHFALLQNPVINLPEADMQNCREALETLQRRIADCNHSFYKEMLGNLLAAHILDVYDIHSRCHQLPETTERTVTILRRFMEMLFNGDYIHHRNLEYYSSILCITPHYLSEISNRITGQYASYWIDRYTMREISRLLRKPELSLTDITYKMNFSSLSYFSRYVQKRIGMTPSEYRKNLK